MIDILIDSNAIYTGVDGKPFAGSIKINDNIITAVKKEKASQSEIDDAKRYIDLGDKMVLPGFSDSHIHYSLGALMVSGGIVSNLMDAKSAEECVSFVKEHLDKNPNLERICGYGWFNSLWEDDSLPDKSIIDKLIPDTPVYLGNIDGHAYWLNSKALEECNITRDTEVSFGAVGKDKNGEPNGLLFENEATGLCLDKVINFTDEEFEEAQYVLLDLFARLGLTSVSDLAANSVLSIESKIYSAAQKLLDDEKLTVRINFWPSMGLTGNFEKQKELEKKYNSDMLRVCGVKQFVDGTTSVYTACMLEPYEDNPDTCGSSNYPADFYKEIIPEANKHGLSVRLHCIGDGAVRIALDGFEKSKKINDNYSELHNCMEHVESISEKDIPRLKELDVIASVQPCHLPIDENEKISRIGKERCRYEWPFKSFDDIGVTMAFGTDFPMIIPNPFVNLHAAVTRCDTDGNPTGANPQEKISLECAINSYTLGSAISNGMEDKLGTLESGKLADITIINNNLFEIDENDILNSQVEMTIVDGKIVFEK